MYSAHSYHKIISGVSIHAKGQPVVVRAANIAKKTNATVTLVHNAHSEQQEAVTDETIKILESWKSKIKEVEEVKLVTGNTWMAINDLVIQSHAELVVIGSHVHGQIRTLLGKAGDQVLHHACCDVLVVRSEAYNDNQTPRDYQNIVMATDLSEHNKMVCGVAADFAEHYKADLTILHVVEHYPTDRESEDIAPENQNPMDYKKTTTQQHLADFLASIDSQDVPQKVVVTDDSAKSAVPAYAKHHNVDLIIVGAQEHFGVNMLLGSTVDHIAHHAPCDVLVVYSK